LRSDHKKKLRIFRPPPEINRANLLHHASPLPPTPSIDCPKICDEIKKCEDEERTFIAFEFFPPRTAEGVTNLNAKFATFATQKPLYVDVTWGAGGSTSDLTIDLCSRIKKEHGMTPNMHLTCTNMPEELIAKALESAKSEGIRNIVALRGDPPKGQEEWKAAEGGFTCALDLVKHIRKHYGDYFCLSVAGYPEGHPTVIKKVAQDEQLTDAEKKRVVTLEDGDYVCHDADYAKELAYLKEKVDAGADMIITQMFFDVEVYIQFVADCRAIGIKVPILPGLMVVQNYGGFIRMIGFCKSRVPAKLRMELDAVKDDDAAVKAVGAREGAAMCRRILESGTCGKGLHLYSLNQSEVSFEVLSQLGLKV
jgi:methylenetetrahydrofolate reductase (NADPH)